MELNVKIKTRYDTSTNWTSSNPVLLAGELGAESDTKRMKIGDGSTEWKKLSYTDEGINTWRNINVNGTAWKTNNVTTGPINFKNGNNINITTSGNDIIINSTASGGGSGKVTIATDTTKNYLLGFTNTTGSTDKLYSTTNVYFNNDRVYATGFSSSSDRRLKNIGKEIKNEGLNIIQHLPLYEYSFKNNPEVKFEGIIAQDLQNLLPEDKKEIFIEEDDNGYLTIAKSELIFLAFDAIKELKAENDLLKGRIEILEKRG